VAGGARFEALRSGRPQLTFKRIRFLDDGRKWDAAEMRARRAGLIGSLAVVARFL